MKVKEITDAIEAFAPLSYQQSFDNAGLITGRPDSDIAGVLFCLDVTDAVLAEAIAAGAGMIVSHHPILFHPIKTLTGNTREERIVIEAVRNDIALYAAHTNLDNAKGGVNYRIAEKLGLHGVRPLDIRSDDLVKIAVHTPADHADRVRGILTESGAGKIGNYDSCTFNVSGTGTYRPLAGADPFLGRVGKLHREEEIRTEAVAPRRLAEKIVRSLREAHPYEEMAYEVIPLEVPNPEIGSGAIGELPEPVGTREFLRTVREIFDVGCLRHSNPVSDTVRRIALCGGAGGFLLEKAIRQGADAYLTADLKYDQFHQAEGRILLADFGHYESEYCALELLYDIVRKKFPNFALHKSVTARNPINYFS